MSDAVIDVVPRLLVLAAALLSVAAGIGLLRFPDALSRLHAATKPQILGLLLVLVAIAIDHREWATVLALVPVMIFQSLTAPISAHMVGRAAYRTGELDRDSLILDELKPAIERNEQI